MFWIKKKSSIGRVKEGNKEAFINPTLAEELPLLGSVVKVLNHDFGINIRYTENRLDVNESFNTENFKITIESVDYVNY